MSGASPELLAAVRLQDVIAAVSSPPGRGAVGIVRASGPADSLDSVISRLLPGAPLPDRRLVLRSLRAPDGSVLDRALAVRFVGPRSYTGEDVLELHLHGNPVLLREALRALVLAGARVAEPGEFTRRALGNGRLDLVQAEAVDALIRAPSLQATRLAQRHLGGELKQRLTAWRDELLTLAVALEALVDFPEDVDEGQLSAGLGSVAALRLQMEQLAASTERGRRLVDGCRVVLAGPVNAGKSTLFNALLGHRRAIVSAVPGTTRDVVSESVDWAGLSFRLEDTAGRREGVDAVEAEGISRSVAAEALADLVLQVRDGRAVQGPWDEPDFGVATHADLLDAERRTQLEAWGWQLVSPSEEPGIEALRQRLLDSAAGDTDELLLHTERQRQALLQAAAALAEAEPFGLDEPVLCAEAVRRSGTALEELAGAWTSEGVLDALFTRFCIGK